jgi:hypothetical protein
MPEQKTLQRARAAKRAGKAPSTQAGAFVQEQIDKVWEGRQDVKSKRQAVAIGLSQARRAGVDLPPPADQADSRKHSAAKRKPTAAKKPHQAARTQAAHTRAARHH